MTVGVAVLAHERLDRVAELVLSLAAQDCRVAVHVDARADPAAFQTFAAAAVGHRNVRLLPRIACEWGMFSLVEATLAAARLILDTWCEVGHVCLVSGACLPIRPVPELRDFLAASGPTDFIESVNVGAERWVQGGLSSERFTLHFPFSWRRQRWFFDRAVTLQRRFGVRRSIPAGVSPHIGSQWWCLSRQTLAAILDDPRREEFDGFFARTWIPDETYFQTLVRRHAVRIESRSLTFARFDHQGKPHVFYADHAGLLAQSECFFARKIWPGAGELYAQCLDPGRTDFRGPTFRARALERPFREATRRRCEGRAGYLTQSRFPCRGFEAQPAAPAPYLVFEGFDALAPGWQAALALRRGAVAHGRLFAADRVEFADGGAVWKGNIPASPRFRDRAPEQFLLSVLRQDEEAEVSLQFSPLDSPRMARHFRRDPRARLFTVGDAWLLSLFAETGGNADVARSRLAAWKSAVAGLGRAGPDRAQVETFSLAEAVADPLLLFRRLLGLLRQVRIRGVLPRPRPVTGIAAFALALGHPGAGALADAERERAVREALYEEIWDEIA